MSNTPATADMPADALHRVRNGTRAVALVLGVFLLAVAAYYVYSIYRGAPAPVEGGEAARAASSRHAVSVVSYCAIMGLTTIGFALSLPAVSAAGGEADRRLLGTRLASLFFTWGASLLVSTGYNLWLAGGAPGTAVDATFVWMSMTGLILLVGGYLVLGQAMLDDFRFVLTVMVVGTLVGLTTTLLGFALPFTRFAAILAGGLASWRKDWYALFWPIAASLGGLALMFAVLQLGRGMERRNQTLRRLIYGFNAGLTGLLVVAVLSLANVLAFAEPFKPFFGRQFDWTKSEIYAVSDSTRTMIRNLTEEVNVFCVLPVNSPHYQNCKTLLNNFESISPKFKWQPVAMTEREVVPLARKFGLSDPTGLLVVVGKMDEKTTPTNVFIPYTELFETLPGPQGAEPERAFVGENALRNALLSLTEGKMVLYFTQGHGEPSLDGPAPGARPQRGEETLSRLKTRLTGRKNVEVKPLVFDDKLKAVPDDAAAVVVVSPRRPFAPKETDILRVYAKRDRLTKKARAEEKDDKDAKKDDKKQPEAEDEVHTAGKLVFALEPVTERREGAETLVPLGLESLLAEYGVKAGTDQVIDLRGRFLLTVDASTPANSANPVARAFGRDGSPVVFSISRTRTVSKLDVKGPANRSVDVILQTHPSLPRYWAETNFAVDLRVRAAELDRDDALAAKVLAKDPLPLAVAVSEGGTPPGMPRDAAHGGVLKDTPRMVVFGSSLWLTQPDEQQIDLFNSCVSWLRGTSSGGSTKIPGKKRDQYKLNVADADLPRLTWMPLGLLLLGVVGLGAGVWVVRRK